MILVRGVWLCYKSEYIISNCLDVLLLLEVVISRCLN